MGATAHPQPEVRGRPRLWRVEAAHEEQPGLQGQVDRPHDRQPRLQGAEQRRAPVLTGMVHAALRQVLLGAESAAPYLSCHCPSLFL